jgi:hypothetical protein
MLLRMFAFLCVKIKARWKNISENVKWGSKLFNI